MFDNQNFNHYNITPRGAGLQGHESSPSERSIVLFKTAFTVTLTYIGHGLV